MLPNTISHIIAQTICECEGKDWLQITSAERDRFARIGLLAEDRIWGAVLDGRTEEEAEESVPLRNESPGTGKSLS